MEEVKTLISLDAKSKNLNFTLECEPKAKILGDSQRLLQVMVNLINNARDASQPNSNISLLATIEREQVKIAIIDEGIGIAPAIRDRIFDPFFTTKDVGKGTGLGLTVARTLIQEHGGKIHVEAHPKGGTSFFIALPVTSITATQKKQIQALVTKPHRGATLLLVEDEQALAAAVIEFLSDAGFKVTHAGNGNEALEFTNLKEFDLVVCDLKMPKMSGIDFYHAFKNKHDASLETLFVFVTGNLADTKTEKFLKETGCHWLAKPFRLADLLRTIQEVLTP